MAITLTDEVQYRCAGYIQAEIERYADKLEAEADESEDEDGSDDDALSSEEEDEGENIKKNKSKKGRKAPKEGT